MVCKLGLIYTTTAEETDLLDSFFTWVLDGAICWYITGLVDIPIVMQQATAEFIIENDETGEFLADETVNLIGSHILSSILYCKYCDWCRARNIIAKKLKAFSQDIGTRYVKERQNKGHAFIGLAFRIDDPNGMDI